MSNLVPFHFNTSVIRVINLDNGDILFLARDVASALGYKNPSEAYNNHCKSLIKLNYSVLLELNYGNPHPKGEIFIKENDVYRLTLKSQAENAEPFQDWVCEEVLPSIRKTGVYSKDQAAPVKKPAAKEIAEASKAMLSMAKAFGFSGNQALLHADRATKKLIGESPLSLMGAELIAEVKEKLLTPTDIGLQLDGISAKAVNKLLEKQGFQESYRDLHDKQQWQPTDKGKPYGEMLDSGKHHSDGTPIKQWKWFSSIVDVLRI